MLEHGRTKFPRADVVASSAGRGWTDIAAELRSHPQGELAPIVPAQMEITLTLSGDGGGSVYRRGDGASQKTPILPGTIWLCPIGVAEDSIFIEQRIERVAHVYLPGSLLAAASLDHRGGPGGSAAVDYVAGIHDALIEQIVMAVIAELIEETAGGRLLVDTLALALSAGLLNRYGTVVASPARSRAGLLDRKRLRRVLDFINDEIEGDLSVERLSEVACLSRFHFSRAFRHSLDISPHQYVSRQRLRHAERLLAGGARPIAEIALACGFSSQANFNRAFLRATGMTPGSFRARSRA